MGSEGRRMLGKWMQGALSASWWHRSNWGTSKALPVSLGPMLRVGLGDFPPDDGDESDFLGREGEDVAVRVPCVNEF